MSLTLCHSDSVSGTTILDDGTKVYWTEGYSDAVIVHPDGTTEIVDAHSKHPVLQRPELAECMTTAQRGMTTAEEVEFYVAREPKETQQAVSRFLMPPE